MEREHFVESVISMIELCSDEMVRAIYHFVLQLVPRPGGEECE